MEAYIAETDQQGYTPCAKALENCIKARADLAKTRSKCSSESEQFVAGLDQHIKLNGNIKKFHLRIATRREVAQTRACD